MQARAEAMAALTAAAPKPGTSATSATTMAASPVTTTLLAQRPALSFPVAAADAHAASHELWIYEKDKDVNTTSAAAEETHPPDWNQIPRQEQGVSRPTARMYHATAVLGHMMYVFGGYDPVTHQVLTDIWTLSLKTNKWSKDNTWLPNAGMMNHVACPISTTEIVLWDTTTQGGTVYVYDMEGPTPEIRRQVTTGTRPPPGLHSCGSCGLPRLQQSKNGYDRQNSAMREALQLEIHRKVHTNLLVFGGAMGTTNKVFSAETYLLDTQSWIWTKLQSNTNNNNANRNTNTDEHSLLYGSTPVSQKRQCPLPLQSPCLVSLDNSPTNDGDSSRSSSSSRDEDDDNTNTIDSTEQQQQCIVFGGVSLQLGYLEEDTVIPCDETWLMTVHNHNATLSWEQIAIPPTTTTTTDDQAQQPSQTTPRGRIGATLVATHTPQHPMSTKSDNTNNNNNLEVVLQGGYDPITKTTYGGDSTWILTKDPIDGAARKVFHEARKSLVQTATLSAQERAAERVSEILARVGQSPPQTTTTTGSNSSGETTTTMGRPGSGGGGFNGTALGVGGLDDVLEEIKTRIWTPLAAPPQLLKGMCLGYIMCGSYVYLLYIYTYIYTYIYIEFNLLIYE